MGHRGKEKQDDNIALQKMGGPQHPKGTKPIDVARSSLSSGIEDLVVDDVFPYSYSFLMFKSGSNRCLVQMKNRMYMQPTRLRSEHAGFLDNL